VSGNPKEMNLIEGVRGLMVILGEDISYGPGGRGRFEGT